MTLRGARNTDVPRLPAVEASSDGLFEGVQLESTADPDATLPLETLYDAL